MRVALVLAAGSSRRFGRPSKLFAPLGGRPLVSHALDAAAAAAVRVLLVAGRDRARLAMVARRRRARLVHAPRARAGLAASLVAGLRAVRPIERELVLFLADMPFAAAPRCWRIPPGRLAIRPIYRGRPGHPLLVRTAAARAAALTGDRGLVALLPQNAVAERPGSAAQLIDIDTAADLRAARRIARGGAAFSGAQRSEKRC